MLVNITELLFNSPNPYPNKLTKKRKTFLTTTTKKANTSFLRCFKRRKVHRKSPWEKVTLFTFLLDTQPVG